MLEVSSLKDVNNLCPELEKYREIRLRLNSANSPEAIKRCLGLEPDFTPGKYCNNRPLVEVVVGLNPNDHSTVNPNPDHAQAKACGNNCSTCFFEQPDSF